jgi:hypothetical protein
MTAGWPDEPRPVSNNKQSITSGGGNQGKSAGPGRFGRIRAMRPERGPVPLGAGPAAALACGQTTPDAYQAPSFHSYVLRLVLQTQPRSGEVRGSAELRLGEMGASAHWPRSAGL